MAAHAAPRPAPASAPASAIGGAPASAIGGAIGNAPANAPINAIEPTRVMICDDSRVVRAAIARILQPHPELRVTVQAANGREAVDALATHTVDVVVLDIEMPVMDGLTALPLLLAADRGLGIIAASSVTTRGAKITMQALRLGAADYVPKPQAGGLQNDAMFAEELVAKIRGLGRLRRARSPASVKSQPAASPPAARAPHAATMAAPTLRPASRERPILLAIGASTGGPNALFALIADLGRSVGVPVVLTQHMPATFIPILADHINRIGAMPCAVATPGAPLVAGQILIAPGERHLLVERYTGGLRVQLSDGPPENYCRPAVDPMLRTAADATRGRLLVAMLTGMGQDGLIGTRHAIECGATALAQDEITSVVWGMPGAIANAGLAHAVLPLHELGGKIAELLGRGK